MVNYITVQRAVLLCYGFHASANALMVPYLCLSLFWSIQPQSATFAAVVLLYSSLAAVMIILDFKDVTSNSVLFLGLLN